MAILSVFCLILSIQICCTKELSSSENNLREKYCIIEDFKLRNNSLENYNQVLLSFIRQDGLIKLKSNPKVEKPKLEKNKLKQIVKTRLPSKYFSKVKQRSNRAVSKTSSKFSGLKRTFSKYLSRPSSKIKNKFRQAKKQFPDLKLK